MTIYGHEIRPGDFELTLSDCHVMDEHWSPKYKRVRGKDIPVYDVPKGPGTNGTYLSRNSRHCER